MSDSPSRANNVLVLGPSVGEAAGNACRDLVAGESSEQVNFLGVTFTQPAERLRVWKQHVGAERLADTTLVVVGDAAKGEQTAADADDHRWIPDPTDTMALGFEMVRYLARWAPDEETFGCVHTLSDLLGTAGRDRTVELLERLLPVSASLDARIHYHLDPDRHDEETVALLAPLFDTVVEVREDGTLAEIQPSTPEKSEADAGSAATDGYPPEGGPSMDTLLELVADSRRRAILRHLDESEPGVPVETDALVDRLLATEDDASDSEGCRRRLAIELHHHHLPKLADAGLVAYDPDAGVVRRQWGVGLSLWLRLLTTAAR